MAPRGRSGRINRGRNAQPAPEEPYVGRFVSQQREQEYLDDYRHRKIHKGKFVSSNLLSSGNLIVGQRFNSLGWSNILSFNDSFAPDLIREFYANLSFNTNDLAIYSQVNNTVIRITREDLRTILGITTPVGLAPPIAGHQWPDFPPHFPHSTDNAMIQLVCNKRMPLRGVQPEYKYLTLNARLIHTIATYNIIPHSGSKSLVSKYEAFLTWCILNEVNLDLPTLIFRQMMSFREKRSSHLAYPSLIHKILIFCQVPLQNINNLETYSYLDGLDRTCIKKMGYMTEFEHSFFWAKKTGEPEEHNGVWELIAFTTRRRRNQVAPPIAREEEEEEDEDDEDYDEEEEVAMEDAPENSNARLSTRKFLESLVRNVDQFQIDTQAMRRENQESFAQVNTRLDGIEGRLNYWDQYYWDQYYPINHDDDDDGNDE